MLVLSRKAGEEIQIGPAINVVVLAISKSRVKLGVSGPRSVVVVRAEVMTRPCKRGLRAAKIASAED